MSSTHDLRGDTRSSHEGWRPALTYAGHVWGLGRQWARLPFVSRHHQLNLWTRHALPQWRVHWRAGLPFAQTTSLPGRRST